MEKKDQIYEGKAKILYKTDDPELVIQYFKDDATAFNAAKKGTIEDKGVMNNAISSKIFEYLKSQGIPTHFEEKLNDREMLIKSVKIVPIEVIVRNRAAGSFSRNYDVEEGTELKNTVIEFSYKRDDLNDPLINEYHIRAMGLATDQDLETIKTLTFKINDLLSKFFNSLDLELIDFKLEFGRFKGDIILADEISPDTCRLWEVGTGNRLDKDRFRHDLGNVKEAYQDVVNRVTQQG